MAVETASVARAPAPGWIVVSCVWAMAIPAMAQAGASSDDPDAHWRFELTPSLWIPAMNGEIGVGGLTGRPDQSLGDAFDDQNFAVALHGEWQSERISFFADGLYTDLAAEGATGGPATELSQIIFEAGGGFAMVHRSLGGGGGWPHIHVEPIAGARLQYVDASVQGIPGTQDESDAWVDGFVGLRARLRFTGAVAMFGRVDLGGGGSDFVWNADTGVDVTLAPRFKLVGGYRWFDTDYRTDEFVYDTLLQGPYLGVTFRF